MLDYTATLQRCSHDLAGFDPTIFSSSAVYDTTAQRRQDC
jgi:hypothetical protein